MNKILVIILLAFVCISSSVIQQPTVVIQQPMQPVSIYTATFEGREAEKLTATVREWHYKGYQTVQIQGTTYGRWILVMHKYK